MGLGNCRNKDLENRDVYKNEYIKEKFGTFMRVLFFLYILSFFSIIGLFYGMSNRGM